MDFKKRFESHWLIIMGTVAIASGGTCFSVISYFHSEATSRLVSGHKVELANLENDNKRKFNAAIAESRSANVESKSKLRVLRETNATLRNDVNHLEQQLTTEVNAAIAKTRTKFESQIAESKSANAENETQIRILKEANAALANESKLLKSELQSADAISDRLTREVTRLKTAQSSEKLQLELLANLANYLDAKSNPQLAAKLPKARSRLVAQVRKWWETRTQLQTQYGINLLRLNTDLSVGSTVTFANGHRVTIPPEIKKQATQ